jgi:hypothetical protein
MSALVRGSFRIAGIETAIRTQGSRVEQAALKVLGPYFESIGRPVCRISLVPKDGVVDRIPPPPTIEIRNGTMQMRHGWFEGSLDADGNGDIEVAPHPRAVALCLQLAWATIALQHGAMLVAMAGLLSRARAHLIVDPDNALLRRMISEQKLAVLSMSQVAIAPHRGGWIAATTPFDGEQVIAPRWGPLAVLWFAMATGEQDVAPVGPGVSFAALLQRGVIPVDDPGMQRLRFDRSADLAEVVPAGTLRLNGRTRWDVVDGLASALEVRQAVLAWEHPAMNERVLEYHAIPPTYQAAGHHPMR